MEKSGICPGDLSGTTALLWEGDNMVGAGTLQDNVLKYIAVDGDSRGRGLCATVVTELRKQALEKGIGHLFLYTKPENRDIFAPLFFYPVAETDKVLLMENRRNGARDFVRSLPAEKTEGVVGAVVANCNPFSLGHRYLIEKASEMCDLLYVFVVSEDISRFSFEDRMAMAEAGVGHIPGVRVLPTGPYLVSRATFPAYFLKEEESAEPVHAMLDVDVFARYFVPRFGITRRFVGQEPFCPVTREYNRALEQGLCSYGVSLTEIPRLEREGIPISASRVRSLMDKGDLKTALALVPETSYEYIEKKFEL